MKVAVMGYGTVGSGVVEVIEAHKKSITKHTDGEMLEVSHILDLRDFENDPHKDLFTKDFNDILNDGEVKVVAEAMGGVNPAYDFTMKLLKAGKSVVTSNKELVAQKGLELLNTAKENGVNYLFEASVGGGIPIIRPMHQCLTANNIIRIAGILNGTTNYILNQMIKSGQTFDAALKDAQAKGFAERNPAADIEGHDACRKIAILTSLASGLTVDYNDIETKGITDITLDDVNYAAQMDAVIKLIGFAEFQEDGKIYSIVSPMVVKNDSPLSGVDGVMNAIMVTGDCVGNVMFYGAGAGKLPTASAVVADVVDAVKHIERSKKIMWVEPKENIMANSDSKKFAYFIRTTDNAENIRGIFGKCEFVDNIVSGESAFVTEPMSQSDAEEKSGKLKDVVSMIKVLD